MATTDRLDDAADEVRGGLRRLAQAGYTGTSATALDRLDELELALDELERLRKIEAAARLVLDYEHHPTRQSLTELRSAVDGDV